jgi:hypothetical protein
MALGSVLAGLLGEKFLATPVQALLAMGLVWSVLPYLTDDGYRPLTGDRSIFRTERTSNYFRDIPSLEQPFRNAIRFVLNRGCDAVGIDYSDGAYQGFFISAYEFPVMQILNRERPRESPRERPRERPVRFYHPTTDPNVTTPYREPACAIVCLDCALDAKKQQRYGEMSSRHFDPVIVYYAEARRRASRPVDSNIIRSR